MTAQLIFAELHRFIVKNIAAVKPAISQEPDAEGTT